MASTTPPVSLIREALSYDKESGVLTWRVRPLGHFTDERSMKSWNSRCAGRPAGTKRPDGYLQVIVTIERQVVAVPAHRIAFALVTGHWPSHLVDHKNGVRDDNRWANLRAATVVENSWNTRGQRVDGASGVAGVRLHKPSGLWNARMKIGAKRCSLGYFKTLDAAAEARRAAELANRGEFTPLN